MPPDPGIPLSRLTSAVGEGLTRDAMGELVSREVASWVPHDALNLVGLDPASGTISFGFWHRYPRDLARAEMLNCFLGEDSMRPVDLARRLGERIAEELQEKAETFKRKPHRAFH